MFYTGLSIASAPVDYSTLNETVIITSSPSVECVNVSVVEDGFIEGLETFHLQLDAADPAVLLVQPNRVDVIIVNTDGKFCTFSETMHLDS